MTFLLILSFLLIFPTPNHLNSEKWGKTGHRIVGDIATDYLNEETKNELDRVLGHESLAIASTWMDKIRSDDHYDHTHDWHWVTLPDGMSYDETEKNPNGDLIKALRTIIEELKMGDLPAKEEAEKLKMLVHLIGDLHQPMHVGTGKDRGGNDTRVEWFYEPSNLHRVWDSEMIDETKLSYTEFSNAINHPSQKQLEQWQQGDVLGWAYETRELRDAAYALPEDKQIGYRYMYLHRETIDQQLLKAGVRLAYVLNQIYG
ncbi:S1/P1 nuclease [Fodinibius salsisoli]|uniref:S1/P1 nuclease n=1 Tax=Fodinibius salsisoli TaxID=2820877 RepID=A0ABT3PMC6_9BACT|nr:S1/P1 nuclease [Fodinibius salsisoli]MCW9707103.1 S1/P1 nuclease [Fodinibius salsisoli]